MTVVKMKVIKMKVAKTKVVKMRSRRHDLRHDLIWGSRNPVLAAFVYRLTEGGAQGFFQKSCSRERFGG